MQIFDLQSDSTSRHSMHEHHPRLRSNHASSPSMSMSLQVCGRVDDHLIRNHSDHQSPSSVTFLHQVQNAATILAHHPRELFSGL